MKLSDRFEGGVESCDRRRDPPVPVFKKVAAIPLLDLADLLREPKVREVGC